MMLRKIGKWGLCIGILFSTAGCDEEESYRFCEGEEDLALNVPCDISLPSCQQAVFEATRCVNGSTAPIPSIRVITEAEYLEELGLDDTTSTDSNISSTDTNTSDGDTDTVSTNTDTATADTDTAVADTDTGEFRPWDRMLHMLGLLEEEESSVTALNTRRAADVGAYYSRQYQDVTIIQRDTTDSLEVQMYILAHEYTHAIQDYEYGLKETSELYSYDDDIGISIKNAIEGDANVRSDFAFALLAGMDVSDMYIEDYYNAGLAYYKRIIAGNYSPYVYAKDAIAYATGALYVYDTFLHEGIDGINQLRENFPTASVCWMAGYDACREGSLVMPLQCTDAEPANEYELYHQDTLGATVLYAILSSYRTDATYDVEDPWNLALQWRGDSIQIFEHVDKNAIALFWRIRMATITDAATLQAQLTQQLNGAVIPRVRDEVIVFMAEDSSVLAPWIFSWSCVSERVD